MDSLTDVNPKLTKHQADTTQPYSTQENKVKQNQTKNTLHYKEKNFFAADRNFKNSFNASVLNVLLKSHLVVNIGPSRDQFLALFKICYAL